MTKRALITGITGQDGSYLTELLLGKGYDVYGIIRRASTFNTERLGHLYQDPHSQGKRLHLVYGDLNDASSLNKILRDVQPDEIYNLGAQSHVRVSFDIPEYSAEVGALGTLRLLEAIRETGLQKTRFYQASSSELYGKVQEVPQRESTPFYPRSPYAVAKAAAYWQVATYREAYGMFACTGILANHESPLRPTRFVTQKIIEGVRTIKAGLARTIELGNLDIWRDWGWAPDYVQAMVLMLQTDKPTDYLIASGYTTSLRQFAQEAFNTAGLDLGDHLESVKGLRRPADLAYSAMNPTEISQALGWKSKRTIREIVEKMYNDILF